jgi:hypothetical protein
MQYIINGDLAVGLVVQEITTIPAHCNYFFLFAGGVIHRMKNYFNKPRVLCNRDGEYVI